MKWHNINNVKSVFWFGHVINYSMVYKKYSMIYIMNIVEYIRQALVQATNSGGSWLAPDVGGAVKLQ